MSGNANGDLLYERFLQISNNPFLGFTPMSWVSPNISHEFGPIYCYHQGVCLGEKRRICVRDGEAKLLLLVLMLDAQMINGLQTLAE